MHFSTLFAGITAAAGLGQAAAASITHRGVTHKHAGHHGKDHAMPMAMHRHAHLKAHEAHKVHQTEKREAHLSNVHQQKLRALGIPTDGMNSNTDNGHVWIGVDGPFTNTFTNTAGEDVMLVVWGSPWITDAANQPWVTMSMPAGCNRTLSFANGASGAWSVLHHHTGLDDAGMIDNTWGEFTMDPTYGTIDVSREVNMLGSHMTIETPNCVSSMDRCVFVCPNGQKRCWQQYILHNCENGSQPGASYGTDPNSGMPSGGCASFGTKAHLHTTLGPAN